MPHRIWQKLRNASYSKVIANFNQRYNLQYPYYFDGSKIRYRSCSNTQSEVALKSETSTTLAFDVAFLDSLYLNCSNERKQIFVISCE